MKTNENRVLLNRAVFTRRSYDSRALTILTTFIHHFPEPGDYEAFVWREGVLTRQLTVHVAGENAPLQHTIDMAAVEETDDGCGCTDKSEILLRAGGVLIFYASQGSQRYSVTVQRSDAKEKRVLANTAEQIPAGDLFAVTLVYPGDYRVTDALNRIEARIRVEMPPQPERGTLRRAREAGAKPETVYRPDQPTTVVIARGQVSEKDIRIFAGQSVVFHCVSAAQIRIEAAGQAGDGNDVSPQRPRYSVRRR